ncbi:electron transfer flavoprotein subunit beta [Frondihabitans sp. PAMC 28766]|uniref:electron transfer flavoprotein subunit beta/FixA family protein n=1 Tax=Frondihabitans sp. PAMC 28766 TaxID=1795630 RepID=UPI00078DA9D8|nr:electron transfer flavoprotein subunit beta/FixA family protein [Frondihabitans sp. PAMC 28766]AMM19986.1 electron transfer flavoprotein subunit beta [Frondihabitans sp. PAMC 28766]
MKIVVLVKQVLDTWGERRLDLSTGLLDRSSSDLIIDEVGERALEAALAYKDANDADVIVMTMGPREATDVLRKGLAMGADTAVHVLDDELAGSDMVRTATVLAAALRRTGFDLVITGNESTDGRGGAIAPMLSEILGVPQVTYLNSLAIAADGISGERGTEAGTQDVHASLPAVASVTERSPEPRFPGFKGSMRAKKKPLDTWALSDLGESGSPAARSVVLSTAERPARTAGRKVVDDGSAAHELAAFLSDEHLI